MKVAILDAVTKEDGSRNTKLSGKGNTLYRYKVKFLDAVVDAEGKLGAKGAVTVAANGEARVWDMEPDLTVGTSYECDSPWLVKNPHDAKNPSIYTHIDKDKVVEVAKTEAPPKTHSAPPQGVSRHLNPEYIIQAACLTARKVIVQLHKTLYTEDGAVLEVPIEAATINTVLMALDKRGVIDAVAQEIAPSDEDTPF